VHRLLQDVEAQRLLCRADRFIERATPRLKLDELCVRA